MRKHQRSSAGANGGREENTSAHQSEESTSTITTAIHIPKDTWTLLRAVAFRRAQDRGGRVSVSKLVAELVERHRGEFEHEIK
jgi:hypothetical protein